DDLGAGAVEGADQRQRQHAVRQRDDRRRELEQLVVLARDDALAALLIDLRGVEAELVEHQGRGPVLVGQRLRILGELAAQNAEDGGFDREDEGRRLARREALQRTAA